MADNIFQPTPISGSNDGFVEGKVFWTVNGYNGVVEDTEGKLADFLSQKQELGYLNYPVFPHSTFSPADYSSDFPNAITLSPENWPDPPRPRLNQLYWPATGATRCAYGLILMTRSDYRKAIGRDVVSPGETPAAKKITLQLRDDFASSHQDIDATPTQFDIELYALQPTLVNQVCMDTLDWTLDLSSDIDSLVIVPVVDERFFWQFKAFDPNYKGNKDENEGTEKETWGQLLDEVNVQLDSNIERHQNAFVSAVQRPDPIQMDQWSSIGTIIDTMCASTGCRFVAYPAAASPGQSRYAIIPPNTDPYPTSRTINEPLETNPNFGELNPAIAGGSMPDGGMSVPKGIKFRFWDGQTPLIEERQNPYFDNISTDYTVAVNSTLNTDSYSVVTKYLTEYANRFFSWRRPENQYDFTSNILYNPDNLNGTEDFFLYNFDSIDPRTRKNSKQTRVKSLPFHVVNHHSLVQPLEESSSSVSSSSSSECDIEVVVCINCGGCNYQVALTCSIHPTHKDYPFGVWTASFEDTECADHVWDLKLVPSEDTENAMVLFINNEAQTPLIENFNQSCDEVICSGEYNKGEAVLTVAAGPYGTPMDEFADCCPSDPSCSSESEPSSSSSEECCIDMKVCICCPDGVGLETHDLVYTKPSNNSGAEKPYPKGGFFSQISSEDDPLCEGGGDDAERTKLLSIHVNQMRGDTAQAQVNMRSGGQTFIETFDLGFDLDDLCDSKWCSETYTINLPDDVEGASGSFELKFSSHPCDEDSSECCPSECSSYSSSDDCDDLQLFLCGWCSEGKLKQIPAQEMTRLKDNTSLGQISYALKVDDCDSPFMVNYNGVTGQVYSNGILLGTIPDLKTLCHDDDYCSPDLVHPDGYVIRISVLNGGCCPYSSESESESEPCVTIPGVNGTPIVDAAEAAYVLGLDAEGCIVRIRLAPCDTAGDDASSSSDGGGGGGGGGAIP